MKRAERNEFNYIRRTVKAFDPSFGTTLTIRTDAGCEYKQALHEFYTGLGFHPAGITTDPHRYDDKERIVYIYGLTWKDDEERDHSWTELYTENEKERFTKALT